MRRVPGAQQDKPTRCRRPGIAVACLRVSNQLQASRYFCLVPLTPARRVGRAASLRCSIAQTATPYKRRAASLRNTEGESSRRGRQKSSYESVKSRWELSLMVLAELQMPGLHCAPTAYFFPECVDCISADHLLGSHSSICATDKRDCEPMMLASWMCLRTNHGDRLHRYQ